MAQTGIHRIKWSNDELQRMHVALNEIPVQHGDELKEVLNRAMTQALPANRRQAIVWHSTALRALRNIETIGPWTNKHIVLGAAIIHKMPVAEPVVPAPAPVVAAPKEPVAVEMTRATLRAMLPHIPKGSLIQLTD